MSRTSRLVTWRPWLMALPVGALAGVLAGGVTQEFQERREVDDQGRRAALLNTTAEVGPPGDTVRALIDQETSVPVHPDLAEQVDPDDLERARSILEETGRPLHLGHLPAPVGIYDGFNAEAAAAQWVDSVGEDGHYVLLLDSGRALVESPGVEREYLAASAQGQPGPALVRIAEEMATWSVEPIPDREPDHGWDDWGGTEGGVLLGMMAAGFVVAPAFLVLRYFVGRSRQVRQ